MDLVLSIYTDSLKMVRSDLKENKVRSEIVSDLAKLIKEKVDHEDPIH